MTALSRDTNQIDNDPGGLTENELWAELAKLGRPERKPNGITAAELAELWGCSTPTARRWLQAGEKAGKFYHEDCVPSAVWYKVMGGR